MKVCAVQLNLRQCFTYQSFINYLQSEVFNNLESGIDLLCFPENINLCLLFCQKDEIKSNSVKTLVETLFDRIISSIDLSFLLRLFKINTQKEIIISAFKYFSEKYNISICTGSYYHKNEFGIFNSASLIQNGIILEEFSKYKLTGFEKSLKLNIQTNPKVFDDIGICICYDLNDPIYIKNMAKLGAKIIVAPSNGWRPFPNYPFDKNKERPQVQRAQENQVVIIRPYCSGWLFPFFYFQGQSHIVDTNGETLAESNSRNKTELLIAEISL